LRLLLVYNTTKVIILEAIQATRRIMVYYIKENFYFDIDKYNQLRITGPQNHLLLGLTIPENVKIEVEKYNLHKKQLVVKLKLSTKKLTTPIPIVTDIRTIRTYTENVRPQPTYGELIEKNIEELVPQTIRQVKRKGKIVLKFAKTYTDERGKIRRYGAKFILPPDSSAKIDGKKLTITSDKNIFLTIKTITNVTVSQKLRSLVFVPEEDISRDLFNKTLLDLYQKAGKDVEYLVRTQKTSSFEYGTIFPRDWIESADLGHGDFSPETIDYMYSQAMKNISETGEGWHEELVGSYRMKAGSKNFIDRKMIDIEPRYIIGMNFVTKSFLLNKENRRKLKLVANYILRNAEEKELITFKRTHRARDEYYPVGNWRDSGNAFPGQKSPLAPYDVNCVFYPTSLKIIREYCTFFQIRNLNWLDEIFEKWQLNKQKYRMYHPYDTVGYALAIHGKKNKQLTVSHLDEAYDLFYGNPNLEEVVSFAIKLADPDFFYTPVGPILVANDEEEYSTGQYHGKVIWPKQAAFAIAGLVRQFRRGILENWPNDVLETIKDVIKITCEACFRGWEELGVIPELYYYDKKGNCARLYTDQQNYEGPMSFLQLWSLVGARRIMRGYQFMKLHG